MKRNLLFLVPALALCIAGCETEKSVDWYIKDKNELITKLSECESDDDSTNCNNARKAAELAKSAVAEGFQIANSCRYQVDLQLNLMDKVIDVEAACPSNSPTSPKYKINQTTGDIKVDFTGDASGIWLTFSKKRSGMAGAIATNQWICFTSLSYEQFMPEVCVSKHAD
ncbi:EexN family lipoprotein [Limnobaculum parvum]|uniref:Uncharacterized protein n=1 Tax=Limnobaculum parvum TaxID=2172103 RepID=A0A2Y9TYL9_9GAMM|nr:EexN family lipoprotein [Limnobaculum parvum]AWH88712.1 hypothetical protein HYN51_09160 [Limnobaculum parvum]